MSVIRMSVDSQYLPAIVTLPSGARRIVIVGVGDAQPTSRTELGGLISQLGAQLGEQAQHDVDGLLVSAQGEDLRPDVRVKADQLEPWMLERPLHRLARGARLDG